MRTENLFEKVLRLEREIEALSQQRSEEKQQEWRFRRGDLAQAQYELFLELERERPLLAVQLLYKSVKLGNRKARDRLFNKKLQSEPMLKEGQHDKSTLSPELLFVYGLQALLGVGTKPNHYNAFQYFQFAARKGYWEAYFFLGRMYQIGRGVPQDDAQALAWYRRAAEQGCTLAQNKLGWMYREGRGVAQHYAQALAWYRRAAELGYPVAQHNLACMYQKGIGVAQDDAQAVAWFRRAAEQGFTIAQNNLGEMYQIGRGVAQDDAQAVAWYRRAAERGDAIAQNSLACMYQKGRGVAQDDVQAVAWLRRAAEQGDANAQENLEWMYDLNRINLNPDAAIDYRKDFQFGVNAALALLKLCAPLSFSAKYHYHLAQGNNSGIREILEKEPNEFFEALMTDTLLTQEARFEWLERLFEEQHRQKNQLEFWRTYNNRPKLKPEYLMSLNMELARNRYALLGRSQLPNKREESNMTEAAEIKWLVYKLESQKRKVKELIEILNTITEDHADYPEAQLILSHLHFRLDKAGSQWEHHFAECEEVDKDQKWIGLQIIPNWMQFKKSCVVIQEYLEALRSKDESKIENLLKQELLEVAQDRYAIEPLLRLSIMAKKPEEFESRVSSLKALGLSEEEIEEKAQSILSKKSFF